MKQSTLTALNQACVDLRQIASNLYTAAEQALEIEDFDDCSLLSSQADKIYEQSENLDILIMELEG